MMYNGIIVEGELLSFDDGEQALSDKVGKKCLGER
jgi:hypothetical protein